MACLLALRASSPGDALGCPFCNAVLPSFAQQREAAQIIALGEVVSAGDTHEPEDSNGASAAIFVRIRRLLKSGDAVLLDQIIRVPRVEQLNSGALCLLLGSPRQDAGAASLPAGEQRFRWTYRPVTETSYAYFAQAPDLRVAAAERLRYFARFLQHPDEAIAGDAYLEFGHAPFDVVAQVADVLPIDKMAEWLLDESVPQERKGFYGIALGLVRDPQERAARRDALTPLVSHPDDDFSAGLAGLLGGYLLVAGEPGLDLIDRRYLADPQVADGQVRSALAALRFYHEYGKEIPVARQRASLRRLLKRPEFAAETIADLARWEDWGVLPEVVALYEGHAAQQPALRRSVVGYLTASPLPAAAGELARLRDRDPDGVAEAERYLRTLGGIR